MPKDIKNDKIKGGEGLLRMANSMEAILDIQKGIKDDIRWLALFCMFNFFILLVVFISNFIMFLK